MRWRPASRSPRGRQRDRDSGLDRELETQRLVGKHSRLVLLEIADRHEAREGFDKGLDVSARVASSGSLAPVAALWTQREVRLRGILKADGRQ